MPWRIARAAVNDQCAWYLGDHAFLPGQSDSGLLSSARRRSTCSAWIAGQLRLPDVLRQLGWRASVRNYAQGQAAHRVRERCADNQPSAASPGDSGDYASAGINGRTRRSASTCASTDRVSTAGKPADLEGDRYQGRAANNAPAQDGADEPGRPGWQCDPRPQLRSAWLSHRWVPVSRRRECRASATPVSAADRFVALEDRRTRSCIRRRRCRRSRNRGEVDTTPPTSSPGRTTAGQ